MKTIVCKLKSNALGWTSIGYPTDELHLPAWFKELPFDDSEMESTVIDAKIDNLITIISENYIYKIFANIMHISLDSGD